MIVNKSVFLSVPFLEEEDKKIDVNNWDFISVVHLRAVIAMFSFVSQVNYLVTLSSLPTISMWSDKEKLAIENLRLKIRLNTEIIMNNHKLIKDRKGLLETSADLELCYAMVVSYCKCIKDTGAAFEAAKQTLTAATR